MIYLGLDHYYYGNMLTDMTDGELITQFLIQKNKAALETLISRHHQRCYEKINNKFQNENLSVDVCKKLWLCVLNKPDDIKLYDNFDDFLDANINDLLKNEYGIIENLIDSVHLDYLKYSIKYNQSQITKNINRSSDVPKDWSLKFKKLNNTSNRRVGMVVLVTLTLIVVSVFYITKPKLAALNPLINLYHSDVLKENSLYLADYINTKVDWQYGFIIEGPESHDAFVAGSYMVDLLNLHQVNQSREIRKILAQLADINLRIRDHDIQNAIEYVEANKITYETIKILVSSFENSYKENSELSYFKFGKWVEFNYLHIKLAIELNDTKIYSENEYKDNKFIAQFLNKGNHPHLIKKDIEKILELSIDKNVTIDKLKQQLKLVEHMRALLF